MIIAGEDIKTGEAVFLHDDRKVYRLPKPAPQPPVIRRSVAPDRSEKRITGNSKPKVFVPYTELNPWTKAVLDSYDLRLLYVRVRSMGYTYRSLLEQLWKESEEPFIIIEQDILPWPGAIEELWQCPCQWGTYSYKYQGGIGIAHMLGIAKITPELIKQTPGIWDDETPWHELDKKLAFAARAKGIEPHLHRPPVIHLSERELGLVK